MGCGGSKPTIDAVDSSLDDGSISKKNGEMTSSSCCTKESTGLREIPDPTQNESFPKRFDELYVLGQEKLECFNCDNQYVTMRQGRRKESGETFTIKVLPKEKLSAEDESNIQDEIAALSSLHHKNIIRLYDVYNEVNYSFLIMEQMTGGTELFEKIVEKECYNEMEARHICKVLFHAVQYCHDRHVAHRDLKPENILVLDENDDGSEAAANIKITGFHLAKRCEKPKSLTTQCGSPGYVAPEILEGVPYDTKADMWSLGVTVYILLGGYPPFLDESNFDDQAELFKKIRKGDYEFHPVYWDQVSQDAKDMIQSLLTVDPDCRSSATTLVKESSWMKHTDTVLEKADLRVNLQKLKSYQAKQKMKIAVSTVISVQRMQKALGENFKYHL